MGKNWEEYLEEAARNEELTEPPEVFLRLAIILPVCPELIFASYHNGIVSSIL
jgi:hypothetical protein